MSRTRASHATAATTDVDALIWETNTPKDVKLIVRPDAGVVNMKAKIDTPADQISNLSLVLKKSESMRTKDRAGTGSSGHTGYDRGYSHCKKPGNGANQYAENPNRELYCPNSGKMSHGPKSVGRKIRKYVQETEMRQEDARKLSSNARTTIRHLKRGHFQTTKSMIKTVSTSISTMRTATKKFLL